MHTYYYKENTHTLILKQWLKTEPDTHICKSCLSLTHRGDDCQTVGDIFHRYE